MAPQQQQFDPLSGCLLRFFWLVLGNLTLVIVAGRTLASSGAVYHLDLIYWSVVGLILAARFADIRYFQGATGEGRPASMTDWRRHAVYLLLVAGTAWGLIHAARLWLPPS